MFIFSNLATSLDGKIATRARGLTPLGTPQDRKQMQVLRKQCDAIIIGASTLRSHPRPNTVSGQKQPINVIVSSSLSGISPHCEFFKAKIQRILFISDEKKILTPRKRAQFEATSQLIPLHSGPRAPQIVRQLHKLGIKRLLVEGGGGLMWDFVQHNLIDEYHVTLTPLLIGGVDAPTLVDGPGFLPKNVVQLNLKKCHKVGNEIYLTYIKKRKKGI